MLGVYGLQIIESFKVLTLTLHSTDAASFNARNFNNLALTKGVAYTNDFFNDFFNYSTQQHGHITSTLNVLPNLTYFPNYLTKF